MPFTDTTERGLESHIEQYLVETNGYQRRVAANYDADACTDADLLVEFLEDTQPKAVATLRGVYGEAFGKKVTSRLHQEIKNRGVVDVLRKGIRFIELPQPVRLFYDRPNSAKNADAWRQYEANRFSVMRQVHYSRVTPLKSLDLVLFLNGLPLATFELKNLLTGQTVKDAIRQYQHDRDPREELFRLGRCLVHFAVDTELVYMSTELSGPKTTFLPFNRGHECGAGNPPNPDGIRTDYLWREVLTKESLTDVLMNFAMLVEEKKEKIQADGTFREVKEKKLLFPRYHQLDAVRRLLADARAHGTGRRYLIQHSAGSGKSNSISWLAHQLIGLHDATGERAVFDSVIVVTDRRVLDAQIRANVQQFELVKGVVEGITEGSRHLRQALEEGKKIIITTIQKFPFVVDEIGDLPAKRFGLIIDEAHSGQSGTASGLMNRALRTFEGQADEQDDDWTGEDEIVAIIKGKKLLPNASYFAFTATPKGKTLETFGVPYPDGDLTRFRAFHLYSMKQAIEEGFILDVLRQYTTYRSYYGLLKKVADDPEFDKKKAQKKLRHYVESHEHAIGQKTATMVEHFVENVLKRGKINGLAKAMVVTSSRKNAVQYKHAFDRYLREHEVPYRAIVAFSGDVEGETEASLNGFESARIPDEFKKAEYRFLIVAEKFQTGFDQPLLHTMYVDKKLSGVSAVQTLSRLNRTAKGKDDTFVLDFANTEEEILTSFAPFYEETKLADATDPNKLFDLQTALDNYQIYTPEQVKEFSDKLLTGKTVDELHALLDGAAAAFRTDLSDEEQDDVRGKVKSYVRLYRFLVQIVPFVNPYLERLYQFLNHFQHKIHRAAGDDLAQGILDTIDMESYRLQKGAEAAIALQQGDYLQPMSTELGSGAAEPELDYLSNIVKTFNERFGTEFSDDEKVRRLMEDVGEDIAKDPHFLTHLDPNDPQNTRIAIDALLGQKLLNHINTNFDVYKAYNDNPDFRAFFAGQMFEMVVKAFQR
jgi:type I restriction enzyme R subunit